MSLYKKYLVRVELVRERVTKNLASEPEAVVKLIRKEMAAFDREYVLSVFLSIDNQVLGVEECSKGTLNGAMVSAREVFKAGILCNAASIILLHNHPSGNCKPSDEDIKVTRMLKQAGEIIGIALIDHIIIGDCDGIYTSLKEKGLL